MADDPKFCRECGRELVWRKIDLGRFDAYTGEEQFLIRFCCSKHTLFDTQHDSYRRGFFGGLKWDDPYGGL